jgi:hypothetical protein
MSFTTVSVPRIKGRIRETINLNNNNPQYGTNGGSRTNDRIFLLSIEEAASYVAKDALFRMASWWWLRSPGRTSHGAAGVYDNNYIHIYGRNVIYSAAGVRPAFWLNLQF